MDMSQAIIIIDDKTGAFIFVKDIYFVEPDKHTGGSRIYLRGFDIDSDEDLESPLTPHQIAERVANVTGQEL